MIQKIITIFLLAILSTACDSPDVLILNAGPEGAMLQKSVAFMVVQDSQQSTLPDRFSAEIQVRVPGENPRKYAVDIEKDEMGYYWVTRSVEAPLGKSFILSLNTSVEGIDFIGYGSYLPDGNAGQLVEIYVYEASAEFAGGSGTLDDPYLVASPDHLNNVRLYKDAYFRQVSSIDLGQAPWNENTGWQSIGYYRSGGDPENRPPFTGVYNGNSYSILNLTIQDSIRNSVALFGWTSEAVLENIRLENVKIRGAWAVGALSGLNVSLVRIENCHSSGFVHGNESVGGLVGTTGWPGYFNYETEGVVINSSSQCTVTGSIAGGLAGWNLADLTDCFTEGIINGTGDRIGGLAGVNGGPVSGCYAMGNVSGKGSVGGLIGWHLNNQVTESYALGNVTEKSVEPWESGRAGGLIGEMDNGTVSFCYATGDVSAKVQAGGLIGTLNFTSSLGAQCIVEKSYAIGTVTASSSNAGGLVASNTGGTIHNCYAMGDVSAPDYAGGLISYNGWDPSTVTNTYSAGKVTGNTNTGGLIGYNNNFTQTTGSYYDGQVAQQSESAGGEGRLTLSMTYPYAQDTYVGWDFNTVWQADEQTNINHGYPFLRFP
jgi:hypothetical protein